MVIKSKKISGNLKKNITLLILAICIVVSLLAFLRWDGIIVQGIIPGLALMFFTFIYPPMTIIFSGRYFYYYKPTRNKFIFILLPIVAVFGSVLTIVFYFLLSIPAVLKETLFLAFIATSICITCYLCRRKGIILLVFILLFTIPSFLSKSLPYIYTPPALTETNLPLYKELIRFANDNSKYDDIILYYNGGWYSPGQKIGANNKEQYKKITHDALHLRKNLRSVICDKMQRDNNILLFFKNANHILPSGPGVAYSLSGDNPNNLQNDILEDSKPFTNISGRWYISRHLALSGSRVNILVETPKSIFDKSLSLNSINTNELNDPNL